MAQAEKKDNKFIGFFKRIGKYFREMKSELKKVVWPTRSQVINNTIVVFVCCLVVGAFIWIFDALASLFVQGLFSLFS